MKGHDHNDPFNFCIAGINYKKTNALLRGQFAIGASQYNSILELAPAYDLHELFILSTCNRTEIYGLTENVQQLIALLCSQTAGTAAVFADIMYVKKGAAAVEHLFNVAAGLDSQILGDYEIIGQLKQSVNFARGKGFIGAVLERMVNAVLQSSKAIKNQTALSGGTVSVSFAAVQYIKEKVPALSGKKILVLGTGKIGRHTCKNMVDYLSTADITLINRTPEKAAVLAAELGLRHAPVSALAESIEQSDIILVATNAAAPTLSAAQLAACKGDKLIIDLSIPYNVEPAAKQLNTITLVNVDDLSKLKDETLEKRKAEVPKAKTIIAAHAAEFAEWHDMRRHVPVLKAVKDKLQQIHSCRLYTGATSTLQINFTAERSEARIQKVITNMAVKMRHRNQRGCQYIEAINDFMATGANQSFQ